MNTTFIKVLRGVVGAFVLIVLVLVVSRWWGEYKTSRANSSGITTETVVPSSNEKKTETEKKKTSEESKSTSKKSEKRKVVVILTDGLNFREEPSGSSNRIRALDEGEKLTYLKKQDGWYQVEDEDGTRGWISARPDYAKVQ